MLQPAEEHVILLQPSEACPPEPIALADAVTAVHLVRAGGEDLRLRLQPRKSMSS